MRKQGERSEEAKVKRRRDKRGAAWLCAAALQPKKKRLIKT